MPYKNKDLRTETPRYQTVVTMGFDPAFSKEDHMRAIAPLFAPSDVSPKWIEKEIQKVLPGYPSGVYKDAQRRAERANLSEAARNVLVEDAMALMAYSSSAQTGNPLPGAKLTRPWCSFLRLEDTAAARSYNTILESFSTGKNPRDAADFLYNEILRAQQDAGIRSPEDLHKLFTLSDTELVSKFPKLRRFTALMMELDDIDKADSKISFTEEQRRTLSAYRQLGQSANNVLTIRLELICNPYYDILDTDYLVNHPGRKLEEHMMSATEEKAPDFTLKGLHYSFSALSFAAQDCSREALLRIQAKTPALEGAILGCPNQNGEMTVANALADRLPVVARTQQGKSMVLLAGQPEQAIGAGAYMTQLDQLATKADKWLLTGSRQFANMQRQLKALNDYCQKNPNAGIEDLAQRTDALRQSAIAYLERKGIEAPYSLDNTFLQGKNQREQSRIDVAVSILGFAQAQGSALEKTLEAQRQQAQSQAKIHEEIAQRNQGGIAQPKAPQEEVNRVQQPKSWQETLEEKANFARNRLDQYVKGQLTTEANGKVLHNSRYVTDDLSILAFQEAMAVEKYLFGQEGAYHKSMEAQGFDQTFQAFRRQGIGKELHSTGLVNKSMENVKNYLENGGPWKAANRIMKLDPERSAQAENAKQEIQDQLKPKELNQPKVLG